MSVLDLILSSVGEGYRAPQAAQPVDADEPVREYEAPRCACCRGPSRLTVDNASHGFNLPTCGRDECRRYVKARQQAENAWTLSTKGERMRRR